MDGERARRAGRWIVLPVLVYTLVAVIITWPLAARLDSHAAGTGYSDTFEVVREAWSARDALRDGRNPVQDTWIAYPHGITSRLMWSTPLRWAPVTLLSFVLPPLAAFNIWLLATVVLNGWAAFWLAMALTDRHLPAALLGGLVFTAFPTLQGHLSVGHVEVLALYGLPLFALCWWRMLRGEGGWQTVVWGGIWLAVSSLGISSQIIYHVMPVALFLSAYYLLAGRLVRGGARWRDQPWLKAAAMIVLGGVFLLPFFGPLLTEAGRAEVEALRAPGRVTFSADPLTFVSLSPFGPLQRLAPSYARDVLGTNATEGAGYLGVVGVALAVAAVLARRRARPWLLVALGAMLFSLGPLLKWRDEPVVVHVESVESYVTLPWAAFQNVPVVSESRTPGRFNGATALAWSALAGIGAGAALRRIGSAWGQAAAAALLGALILVEYQLFWPFPTVRAAQPAYFDRLAESQDVRAVYDAPALHPLAQMQAMFQQTIHHKPMVAGQLHRRSPQNPAVLGLLDAVMLGQEQLAADALPGLLAAVGADRLIVHKQFVPDPGAAIARLRPVLGAPEYEDARIAAFAVPDAAPPAFALASGKDGWSGWMDLDGWQGAFLADDGEWYVYLNDGYGELTFDAAAYRTPRRIAVRLDGRLIGGFVASGDAVRLPLWAAPGFHTLRLEALGGCTPFAFELACLDDRTLDPTCAPVEPPPCLSAAFSAPQWAALNEAPTPVDAALAGGLRLQAYTVHRDGASLHVRLFWEAARALPHDYALFVHLAAPATAEPQAQYDAFPLVPTGDWGDGARWISDVVLDVGDLPPGEYALNVGWFNPTTNTRLPVRGGGPLAAQGIIALGSVTLEQAADQP